MNKKPKVSDIEKQLLGSSKNVRIRTVDELILRYPVLKTCRNDVLNACERLIRCYLIGGMVLICGNGGSAADSGHIVGELVKGFRKRRSLSDTLATRLNSLDADLADILTSSLQMPLPAIDLTAHAALISALSNDQSAEAVYAQQVLAYAHPENLLVVLSTSGNSKNVVYAAFVAKSFGLTTIGLTGEGGGDLARWCDVTIAVPETDTAAVQELHLPVYHALCSAVEEHFFDR